MRRKSGTRRARHYLLPLEGICTRAEEEVKRKGGREGWEDRR